MQGYPCEHKWVKLSTSNGNRLAGGYLSMDTRVSCANPNCSAYGIVQTVAKFEVNRRDSKVCPNCGGPTAVISRINVSRKRGGTKNLRTKILTNKRGNKT
jgi:predicted RNA-binding Zn-ribbon protein involved in translation (DUF1610 family)